MFKVWLTEERSSWACSTTARLGDQAELLLGATSLSPRLCVVAVNGLQTTECACESIMLEEIGATASGDDCGCGCGQLDELAEIWRGLFDCRITNDQDVVNRLRFHPATVSHV